MTINISNQKGFTLIEAVLAMLLLSIAVTGSLVLFHQSTEHSGNIDRKTVATQLAGEFLEKIIADKSYRGFAWVDETQYPPFYFQAPYEGYKRLVDITEVGEDLSTPEPGSDFKKVMVVIFWGDDPGQKTSVSTILAAH